jgi:hypothetical protein
MSFFVPLPARGTARSGHVAQESGGERLRGILGSRASEPRMQDDQGADDGVTVGVGTHGAAGPVSGLLRRPAPAKLPARGPPRMVRMETVAYAAPFSCCLSHSGCCGMEVSPQGALGPMLRDGESVGSCWFCHQHQPSSVQAGTRSVRCRDDMESGQGVVASLVVDNSKQYFVTRCRVHFVHRMAPPLIRG